MYVKLKFPLCICSTLIVLSRKMGNHTHPHGQYGHKKFSLRHEPHVHVLHMIHDVCPFPVSSSGSLSAPITMCLIPVPTFKIDAVRAQALVAMSAVEHIHD